ncbi:DnaJ family domain-containing protein [Paenibacillus apiarius]|uniref:DnaJ family domain-containing protein n=1 Tax=Paenibacillus apiarius TaxID=46240 RepID=UPI001981A5BE|nr:DnaJ family domain-containing protein [Paenibacillus apiarius]MBN3526306.1 DUF1992 domain-containing protein [Paenibacillus apiarius]
MDIIGWIAEQKIQEAQKEGQFDNLEGHGKPLQIKDLSHIPEDLRAGYIVLRNAGILPEPLQMKQEIVRLEQLLQACAAHNDDSRHSIRKQLSERRIRLQMLMEERGWTQSSAFLQYEAGIRNKLAEKETKQETE